MQKKKRIHPAVLAGTLMISLAALGLLSWTMIVYKFWHPEYFSAYLDPKHAAGLWLLPAGIVLFAALGASLAIRRKVGIPLGVASAVVAIYMVWVAGPYLLIFAGVGIWGLSRLTADAPGGE